MAKVLLSALLKWRARSLDLKPFFDQRHQPATFQIDKFATKPRVTEELGAGEYRLEGLRFHMRGYWELELTIVANGKTDSVVLQVTL